VAALGLTAVEPLAAVDVNIPGVMATLVAPVVDQPSVLLEPVAMLLGLAEKELITGLLAAVTVMVAFATVVPAALVAVSV
jgi:flagellar biosynthesis protein FliR